MITTTPLLVPTGNRIACATRRENAVVPFTVFVVKPSLTSTPAALVVKPFAVVTPTPPP